MRVAQWHAFGAVALICWAQWHASTRLGWGWPLHVVWGGQGSGVALRRLFAPSWWWIGVAAGISVLVPWPPSGCSTGCGTPCSARSSRVPPSPCCGMGELPNRCGSIQLIQPVVGIAGTHRSQRALGVLGAPFCIGPAQLDVLMHLARHSSILCRCKGWSGPWCSWGCSLGALMCIGCSGPLRLLWSLAFWLASHAASGVCRWSRAHRAPKVVTRSVLANRYCGLAPKAWVPRIAWAGE